MKRTALQALQVHGGRRACRWTMKAASVRALVQKVLSSALYAFTWRRTIARICCAFLPTMGSASTSTVQITCPAPQVRASERAQGSSIQGSLPTLCSLPGPLACESGIAPAVTLRTQVIAVQCRPVHAMSPMPNSQPLHCKLQWHTSSPKPSHLLVDPGAWTGSFWRLAVSEAADFPLGGPARRQTAGKQTP